jgi:hypothetical protein
LKNSSSPDPSEDFTVDYFGDLEGSNVDELELSPRKESTLRRMMMIGSGLPRQASDLSDSYQISTTPEAESYFRRKADHLHHQALSGELDVNVTLREEEVEGLEVMPLLRDSEDEIEIMCLEEEPVLSVRELQHPESSRRAQMSSFETLYDRSSAAAGDDPLLLEHNRSSFHGTFNVPEKMSSFEQLYEASAQQLEYEEEIPRSYRHSLPVDPMEAAFAFVNNGNRPGY